MTGRSNSQWSVYGLFTVLACGAIAASLVFASLESHRTHCYPNTKLSQLRWITHSLSAYGETNNHQYPGLDRKGFVIDSTVEHRYWVLLDQNYFHGEYLISPIDSKTAWTTGPVNSDQYSYSMLAIDGKPGERSKGMRGREWKNTSNPESIIMSDRNTGTNSSSLVESLYTSKPGKWEGAVTNNDGSARFIVTHLQDTRYGKAESVNIDDNLFEAAGDDDAYMIYTGE